MTDVKYLETGFNAENVASYERDVWVDWAVTRTFLHIKDEAERRAQLEHVHGMCCSAVAPKELPAEAPDEPVVDEPVSSNTRRQRRRKPKQADEEPATEETDENL